MIEPLPLPTPRIVVSDQVGDSQSPTGSQSATVVFVAQEEDRAVRSSKFQPPTAAAIDALIEQGEITGKSGELHAVAVAAAGQSVSLVVVVGLGPKAKLNRAGLFDAAASAIRKINDKARTKVNFIVGDEIDPVDHDAIVAGAIAACEGQHLYQTQPATHVPETLSFVGISQAAANDGEIIGGSVNHTRRLVNEPPTIMNPSEFADRAKAMADQFGLQCEIWDEDRLEKEGCRAILAVGRASTSPPRLVILKHNGGGDQPPVAIVGKGVTFDSGGLSIKPSDGMVDMKCDMAGAATVVGVMRAVAQMGLRRNVIGLCGLAENMISGDSYKLGDVIETRSGKTIEILNTDAEGRVVLADTLDVATDHGPTAIVDLATLTGACMVALGTEVAGLMANSADLTGQIMAAAEHENEPLWELPMFPLYNEKIKSKVADIKNVGEGRWGGAITAAKFLENFVKDTPWVHLDIAGPAFADSPKPARDAGATGVMVRTLIRWLRTHTAD